MDKKNVKQMVCNAIENIPDCAKIKDAYIEHPYASCHAYIIVKIEISEQSEENQVAFHNAAHCGFNSGLEIIS